MIKKIYNKIYSYFFSKKYKSNIKIQCDLCQKINKKAKFYIDGGLIIGCNSIKNKNNVLIRMDENSIFKVSGNARIYYGSDIVIFKDAVFSIGNSFINSDAKIRCHKSITIGNNCTISHDFTIMDSDAHYLNEIKKTEEVIIEDNVWIGTRVTVLPGVKIGKGSVIAAGSVVTKEIPENCIAAGVPAKVIKENITWRE